MRSAKTTPRILAPAVVGALVASATVALPTTLPQYAPIAAAQLSTCAGPCSARQLQSLIDAGGKTAIEIPTGGNFAGGTVKVRSGQEVTLSAQGGGNAFFLRDNTAGPLIHVEPGAKLTVENGAGTLILDGYKRPSTSPLILVEGTLEMNSGFIQNAVGSTGQYEGAVTVKGSDARFVMNGGAVSNNQRGSYTSNGAGNVAVNGGTFEMNGGTVAGGLAGVAVQNGQLFPRPAKGEVGGIGVYNGGTATFNGGTVSGNRGTNGGVLAHNDVDSWPTAEIEDRAGKTKNIIVINGAKISGNTAWMFGGGVTSFANSEVTMNGGEVTKNKADGIFPQVQGYGGGIAAYDNYFTAGSNGYWQKPGFGGRTGLSHSEYAKLFPAAFTLNGGTISENSSQYSAGGVYVASNNVQLRKGSIDTNSAAQGGGVAVASIGYSLHLDNALVTKNQAGSDTTGVGGGIWVTPGQDGQAVQLIVHSTQGGAIYGNQAGESGADIGYSVPGTYLNPGKVNLSDFLLGAGRDVTPAGEAKYLRNNQSQVTEAREHLHPGELSVLGNDPVRGLKNDVSDAGATNADAEASLKITNNKARLRGGGIDASGKVTFGRLGKSYEVIDVAWQDENGEALPDDDSRIPESVTFVLTRTQNGEKKEHEIPVTKANGWKIHLYDLPVKDSQGDITYTLKQKKVDGFEVSNPKEVSLRDAANTWLVQSINKLPQVTTTTTTQSTTAFSTATTTERTTETERTTLPTTVVSTIPTTETNVITTTSRSGGSVIVLTKTETRVSTITSTFTGTPGTVTEPVPTTVTVAPGSSERCVSTSKGIGIPLLLLIPVGIGLAAGGPLFQELSKQIGDPIGEFSSQLQMQAGLYNPVLAQINEQLARSGANLAEVAGGMLAATLGLAAIAAIVEACAPGFESSGRSVPRTTTAIAEPSVTATPSGSGSSSSSS